MEAGHDSSLVVEQGQGEAIWFNGALVQIKTPGAFSDDGYSLAELAMPQGRATALHTDASDETVYVLAGELLFHVDGKDLAAPTGTTVAIRRGTPHAFVAVSEVARFLCLNTPGSHDRFFRSAGVPATDLDLERAPPPDRERTLAAAKEVGVTLLGPPPFPEGTVRVQSG